MQRHFVSLLSAVLAVGLVPTAAHAAAVDAAISCGKVTFTWSGFPTSSPKNEGPPTNTPRWSVRAPGQTADQSGHVSFPGATHSDSVTIPRVNGEVTAASWWEPPHTRSGMLSGGSVFVELVRDCTALSSRAALTPDGAVTDTVVLSGVTDDVSGEITFRLYADSDTRCEQPLQTVKVAVRGPRKEYTSPPVSPPGPGGYQWTAQYSGDAKNAGTGPVGCDDPAEHVVVPPPPVTQPAPPPAQPQPAATTPPACPSVFRSSRPLRGVPHVARKSFTARIAAEGLSRVTFYLDGRKLKTLRPKDVRRGSYRVRINVKRLSRRAHRLRVVAVAEQPACGRLSRQRAFVRPRATVTRPVFTG